MFFAIRKEKNIIVVTYIADRKENNALSSAAWFAQLPGAPSTYMLEQVYGNGRRWGALYIESSISAWCRQYVARHRSSESVSPKRHFPIQNLPYGIFSTQDKLCKSVLVVTSLMLITVTLMVHTACSSHWSGHSRICAGSVGDHSTVLHWTKSITSSEGTHSVKSYMVCKIYYTHAHIGVSGVCVEWICVTQAACMVRGKAVHWTKCDKSWMRYVIHLSLSLDLFPSHPHPPSSPPL